ncbi:9132_t:CDS:10, partial [Gigaspora rosea]
NLSMIETVEDKGEIIKNSINFIWRATSGKAAAIIFNNDPLLSATLTLNDGTSNTVNLDAPSCVIINRENFLKIIDLAKVNEKDKMIIEENYEVIQAEDINLDRQPSDLSLEIEMDIQENTAQNTKSSFDLEEDGTDNNGFDNPISQLLEETQNLNSNTQEPGSDEFSDTDEEIDEIIFDSLIPSSGISLAKSNITKHKYNINEAFKVAKNNYTKNDRSGIEYAPSTLTEDSPLPSVNEALAVLQETSKKASLNKVRINFPSIMINCKTASLNYFVKANTRIQPNQNQNDTDDNPAYESVNYNETGGMQSVNITAEITDAIEKNQDSDVQPNIGSRDVPFVLVNDPIPEFFVDKSNEPTSNDSINILKSDEYPVTSSREKSNDIVVLYKRRKKNKSNINKDRTPENQLNYENVEDNDSDEEIEEQGNLVRKRQINRKYKASKKAKKNIVEDLLEGSSSPSIEVYSKITNTTETAKSSDNSSNKINESTLIIDKLSKITLENSQQANNSIDEDSLHENRFDVHNNQQEDILNKSNSSKTTIVESANSNDSEFSDLDENTNLNISRKRKAFDKKGKAGYEFQELYICICRQIKETKEKFCSGRSNQFIQNVYATTQKYFKENPTEISLNPLPSHIKDVNGCLNYLNIWDQYFNHCEKVINDQQYKRIELIYSLSELFFILLALCSQEQHEESSKKTTKHWKGNNIKTRMYEKLGNKNKRGILMKWTACWRIHHILWVTNITPRELINVDLNATYFLTATNEEYNFLIKELIGNEEFPDFINPKGENILDLVDFAKNIYSV